MTSPQTFTDRSNAKRAAKRLLATGQAPAVDFAIQPGADGRFVINWHTPAAVEAEIAPATRVTTEQVETEIAAATAAADKPARRGRKAKAAKADKAPTAAKGPRAKYAAAVAPGTMPEKPVLTAAGFAQSYQKRIDRLAELAANGEWDAVAAFEVNGHNTYSKIVARYRDQLAAARPTEAGQ